MDFSTPTDIAPYQIIPAPVQPLNQCSLANAGSQLGTLGFFLLLFMLSCFYLKQWHQKRCKQRAKSLHQQVEILERIWSMKTRQEP
jgi:hypothetical protein